MKNVTVSKFKKNYLKILDEVCVTRKPVLIYKGRRIVAKLIPFDAPSRNFLGSLAGNIKSPLWPTGL
jgi:hypothetical protein